MSEARLPTWSSTTPKQGRASHKELTTQSGPARGVMIGIDRLRVDAEIIPRNRPRGARTTLFSNAVIERKRARTGLITTKGSATRSRQV